MLSLFYLISVKVFQSINVQSNEVFNYLRQDLAMQNPNEDTEWNDVLRKKGIIPEKVLNKLCNEGRGNNPINPKMGGGGGFGLIAV